MTDTQAEPTGLVTLNRRGRTSDQPNEYSRMFCEFAATARLPVLDIGAAFGVSTLPALAAGAHVVANDLEPRHLEVLLERTPTDDRARLTLLRGCFPHDLEFEDGSLSAVHASNLLNYLTGSEIERGARLMHRWLVPGGKYSQRMTDQVGAVEPGSPQCTASCPALSAWPPCASCASLSGAARGGRSSRCGAVRVAQLPGLRRARGREGWMRRRSRRRRG
jgi:hypothetical protein